MRRTIFSSRFIVRLVIVALSATLAATLLAVAALPSTGAAPAPKTQYSVTGFGKGEINRAYPSQGVPLLNGFTFRFTRCPSIGCVQPVDHHINEILIAPNLPEQSENQLGEIRLGFQDYNADDFYAYNVRHYVLTDSSEIRRYETGEKYVHGSVTRDISTPTPASDYEFVLIGFQLRFNGGEDHQINEVGIVENNGTLNVTFADGDYEDGYGYKVWYAYVPKDAFDTGLGQGFGLGEANGSNAHGSDLKTLPYGAAVIRGFNFDFRPNSPTPGGDHHIKQIGVEPTSSVEGFPRLAVTYADYNGDDGFDWRVKWGILK